MSPKHRRIVLTRPSRSGCRTCRIRKVKCDESRPQCQKCLSTSRTCDGYDSPALVPHHRGNTSTNRQLLPSNHSHYALPKALVTRTPVHNSITDQDKVAFEFFLQRSAWVIWHISPAKQWIQSALQVGTLEPTVFYAVTAVGSAHRAQKHFHHHTLTQPALPAGYGGLQQYHKATTLLQKYIDGVLHNKSQLEPVLLSCMLFVCFELFQHRSDQALLHLRLGSRLLACGDDAVAAHRNASPRKSALYRPPIRDEMSNFIELIEAELEGAPWTFHPPADHDTVFPVLHATLPMYFASLKMAKDSLSNVMRASARFRSELVDRAMSRISEGNRSLREAAQYCIAHSVSRTIDCKYDTELGDCERELLNAHATWLKLFKSMKQQSTWTDSTTCLLIEIQHFFSNRALSTFRQTREEQMDQFSDENARALDLVQQYLTEAGGLEDEPPAGDIRDGILQAEPQRSFSFESGILPTLHHISIKSRLSSIRYRALQLLRMADRREGSYYSRALAREAADIIRLEEERARAIVDGECNVPEAARLLDVVVESRTPVDVRFICTRYRHERGGELEVSEYRRFGKGSVETEPVWQSILSYRC